MVADSRRRFLTALSGSAAACLLRPLSGFARDVSPTRITNIDVFRIEIPIPPDDVRRGLTNKYLVAKVETDGGVRGYAFGEYLVAKLSPQPGSWEYAFDGPSLEMLQRVVRPALVGKDLFAIESHLQSGLLEWGGIEHAIWDAIGKLLGQPVHRLLGGSKTSIRVYLTCVWPGKGPQEYTMDDQSSVPYHVQAEMAVKIKKAGFKGMKIRAWRPKPTDDADACGEIRAAVGPDFEIMFDRTAHIPGRTWDYPTALSVARALERHRAYWLEEPFDRNDFLSPARLAREVDIRITGGEAYQGLDAFRECLIHNSYDVLQPDAVIAGGIWTVHKIAAMAAGFHNSVILHGSMGLGLAGWLQAAAAIGAEWQELALITPPLLPEEQWSPALKVVNSKSLFSFRDGAIRVPQGPGLGLDVNEEALERYRVSS